jgi:hypothetical protein
MVIEKTARPTTGPPPRKVFGDTVYFRPRRLEPRAWLVAERSPECCWDHHWALRQSRAVEIDPSSSSKPRPRVRADTMESARGADGLRNLLICSASSLNAKVERYHRELSLE